MLDTIHLLLYARFDKIINGELIFAKIDLEKGVVTEIGFLELPFFISDFDIALPMEEEENGPSSGGTTNPASCGYLIIQEEADSIMAIKYKLTGHPTTTLEADVDAAVRLGAPAEYDPEYNTYILAKKDKFYCFNRDNFNSDAIDFDVYDLQSELFTPISLLYPGDRLSEEVAMISLSKNFLTDQTNFRHLYFSPQTFSPAMVSVGSKTTFIFLFQLSVALSLMILSWLLNWRREN
jgi:hypothetical protein